MYLQTILQVVAMVSVLVVITILVINAAQIGNTKNINEFFQNIYQRPVQGVIYRIAFYLALTSMFGEGVIRILKTF